MDNYVDIFLLKPIHYLGDQAALLNIDAFNFFFFNTN
jgi:hypothetical protein